MKKDRLDALVDSYLYNQNINTGIVTGDLLECCSIL